MNGIALLNARALRISPDIACIVMTGHGTIDSAVEAMKGGAIDYVFETPSSSTALMQVIARGLQIRRLHTIIDQRTRELEQANRDLGKRFPIRSRTICARAHWRVVLMHSARCSWRTTGGNRFRRRGARMLETGRGAGGRRRMSQLHRRSPWPYAAVSAAGPPPGRGVRSIWRKPRHPRRGRRASAQVASGGGSAGAQGRDDRDRRNCRTVSATVRSSNRCCSPIFCRMPASSRGDVRSRGWEVSATTDATDNIYAVRDNGVGFDAT